MFVSLKHVLFGSALLLAGSTAFATETGSSGSGVASAPRLYVHCPGIASVPMTADAEQALPLRQIATLTCGEPVAVLNDDEGYTTHVRTADGKDGYVARMYLTKEASPFHAQPDAPVKPVATNAPTQNGVIRWNAGTPGCEAFQSHGHLVESVTSNGVTVQISLHDTGWKLRATIAISNQSGGTVDVLPALITLDELRPNLRNLPEQNPTKLAHSEANHQLMRAEYSAQPTPSAVAFYSNSTPALSTAAERTPVAPDYLDAEAGDTPVRAVSLKAAHLAPGQKTAGELWFARDAGAHELSMRLSIGDVVYDFPFSFQQKK